MPILRRPTELTAEERAELDRTLAAHRAGVPGSRFASDESDFFAFLLLLFLAAGGGLVALLLEEAPIAELLLLPGVLLRGELLDALESHWPGPLFLLCLGLCWWAARTVLRFHKRCGVALLSSGVARVRGRRLAYVRFADVRATDRHDFTMGKLDTRRQVSSVTLTLDDGARITLYAFASAILDAVHAARPF